MQPLLKIMDYKTEMCLMIDNISNVEVFRCIDVDMPDNYVANLQVNQIQRLMKVKSELQSASPDPREVQVTLKRFIVDLDIKEAYEFSVLNPFLINEEELHKVTQEVSGGTAAAEG
jgi:flagellar biosynthesis protein FliP